MNPLCCCGLDIETISHYFLHCPLFHAERSTVLNNINETDSTLFNKSEWFSCDSYPAIWQRSFQGWSKLANLECNYWFCFAYKQIWWTALSSLNSRVIFFYSYFHVCNFTIVKNLIFTFSYYFFCIPGTHKSHGARWLLFLCLMCKCSFP